MRQSASRPDVVMYGSLVGLLAAVLWAVVDGMAIAIWGARIPTSMPAVVMCIYLMIGFVAGAFVAWLSCVMGNRVIDGASPQSLVRSAMRNALVMLSIGIFIERARRGYAYVTDPSPWLPCSLALLACVATILRGRTSQPRNGDLARWSVTITFAALFCTLWMPFSKLYQAPVMSVVGILGVASYFGLVVVAYVVVRRFASLLFANARSDRPAAMLKLSGAAAFAGLGLATTILVIDEERVFIDESSVVASADQDHPNVILLVMDCARADMISAYGYPLPTTPNLEVFAKDAVKYEHAIVTAPWTLPSHASMFTGLLPSQHKAHLVPNGDRTSLRPLDERFDTLAEALSRKGYKTGAVVANAACLSRDLGMAQGFQYYDDRVTPSFAAAKPETISPILWLAHYYKRQVEPAETGWSRNAAEINRDIYTWLDTVGDEPFFLFVNYLDAHEPYFGHSRFASALGSPDGNRWQGDAREDVARYQQELAFVDQQINALFDRLKTDDRFDNSLIIVTSDHGEAFGEHGHHGHCGTLHEEELHVPMLVRYPHGSRTGVVAGPVSLASLPELVSDVVGETLVTQDSSFEHPPHVVAELRHCENGECGIARATYLEDGRKLLFDRRGSVAMYDLAADPHEAYDLSFLADHRVLMHRSRMKQWFSTVNAGGIDPATAGLDQTLQRRLQSLGYVD